MNLISLLGPNTAAEQRAQDRKDEHGVCAWCFNEAHIDDLALVIDSVLLKGEVVCAECRKFVEQRGVA